MLAIFWQLCTTRLYADEFIYYVGLLANAGDFINENITSMPSGKVNIYGDMARIQTGTIIIETDDERKEVRRLLRIAQGHALSYK